MANFVYVDNSNVWIEGMHVSAVDQGLAPDIWEAHRSHITAPWKMDFGRLLQFAGGDKKDIGRAILYGSRPPPNDSVWKAAQGTGFEVVVHDRNFVGKEKKVDTNVVTDMVADSYERMKAGHDEFTLVSGDADYVPTIEQLTRRGFKVHVVFWSHAARELTAVASSFTPLDPHLHHLSFV
jgi:uncharacterized LabA/DUF88 family protein